MLGKTNLVWDFLLQYVGNEVSAFPITDCLLIYLLFYSYAFYLLDVSYDYFIFEFLPLETVRITIHLYELGSTFNLTGYLLFTHSDAVGHFNKTFDGYFKM